MKRVAVVTFGRSDLSTVLPVVEGLVEDSDLEPLLVVTGTHLSDEFGRTVDDVGSRGIAIAESIEVPIVSDRPVAVAEAAGATAAGLAGAYDRLGPDVVLVVGDRYEALAAAWAAVPFGIPVAHVSGGDVTEGATDNTIRYALTALAHLHFVAMESHAERLERTGEEPWRIFVTGDPALDAIAHLQPLEPHDLAAALGTELAAPLVVVTFHPTSLADTAATVELDALLDALEGRDATFVITHPGAEPGRAVVLERLREFCERHPTAVLKASLGQQVYYSLLSHADLMVGNSSSGIWEAPSFRLPVVDVGDRQRGRLRAANVLDAPADAERIREAVATALSPAFRAGLAGLTNPYGDGRATERILRVLREVEPGTTLLRKRFGEPAEAHA